MKRFAYKRYVVFGLIVVTVVSLPVAFIQSVRGGVIRSLSPLWRGANKFVVKDKESIQRIQRLEIENHLLRIEIGKQYLELEKKHTIEALEKELASEKKRKEEVQDLLKNAHSSVVANVIFRDPISWGSSLWINVGEETNRKLNQEIIRKNSPVLFGRSVVGVIDTVGKKQSKVRLITDSSLKPSVRAARGRPQNIFLKENIEALMRQLVLRTDLAGTTEHLVKELNTFKEKLPCDTEGWYLAKGILQGSKTTYCRNLHLLWGIGFNYDYEDKEGKARDLILGKTKELNTETLPILKKGDLLITTGMDGVFPPGLRVAEVLRISPLKEGAYTYEIEAVPSVGNLNDLTTVFVIPPLGFDADEKGEKFNFEWMKS